MPMKDKRWTPENLLEVRTNIATQTRLLERILAAVEPKAELVIPERPEHQPLPTYHQLLEHLCVELGVPGAPTFAEAVASVKARLAGR